MRTKWRSWRSQCCSCTAISTGPGSFGWTASCLESKRDTKWTLTWPPRLMQCIESTSICFLIGIPNSTLKHTRITILTWPQSNGHWTPNTCMSRPTRRWRSDKRYKRRSRQWGHWILSPSLMYLRVVPEKASIIQHLKVIQKAFSRRSSRRGYRPTHLLAESTRHGADHSFHLVI